jgi:hypothetical protein
MNEVDTERRSPQGNLGNFQMISRDDIEERGRRRKSVRTCDRKDTVDRERDSHGFHGRKARYKNHRGEKLHTVCHSPVRNMKTGK